MRTNVSSVAPCSACAELIRYVRASASLAGLTLFKKTGIAITTNIEMIETATAISTSADPRMVRGVDTCSLVLFIIFFLMFSAGP